MKYIKLDKRLAPYTFELELSENVFRLELYYNSDFDYFTLDLYLEDEPILFGEKLVLGETVFDVISYMELIDEELYMGDLSERETRITFENLNEQIFLYVGDEDE